MKKLLFISCTALSLSCWGAAALAGDLNLAGPSYDWSGGYVGLNTGAAFNNSKFSADYQTDVVVDQDTINQLDFNGDGNDIRYTGGILAGYNWQLASFVLGAEADINYIGFNGTVRNDASDVMNQLLGPGNATATDKIEYSADWFGTMRARVGYAMDNMMVYGTGGLAWGQMKIKEKLDATSDNGASASWQSQVDGYNAGWTVGGGIEYAQDRWVLGAEYLYVDLGTYDWGAKGDSFPSVKQKGNADFAFSVARATVKYRF